MGGSVPAGSARGELGSGAQVAAALDPRFSRPRTLFFGVGAQKSATSWLDRYLRAHPEVCLPVRKEQHYWTTLRLPDAPDRLPRVGRKLRMIEKHSLWRRLLRPPKRRAADEAWRRADAMLRDRSGDHAAYADVIFQAWRGQPVVGEITPAYALLDAETFAEIAALAPDVRFLFVMRDPVDRLISGVKMGVRKNQDRAAPPSFDARLEQVLRDPRHPSVLRSRYDLTIARMESVVPAERICYLFFETLFRQEEMNRMADFLGVARRPAAFERKVNAGEPGSAGANPAQRARAYQTLAPVYDFVRNRFGAQTPESWLTAQAGAEPPQLASANS